MKAIAWALIGIVAGVFMTLILLVAVELFGSVVHPFPADFEHTPEAMCAHVERFPAWVLAVVIPMWGATAFVGTWIARLLGGIVAGALVGLLVIGALVMNISMLPYPVWFKALCLLVIPVAAILATRPWRSVRQSIVPVAA